MALKPLSEIRNLDDPLKQFQITFTISDLPALKLAIAQQKVTGIISGNNDTQRHANQLISLLKGKPCHVNLIRLNEVKENQLKIKKDPITAMPRIIL